MRLVICSSPSLGESWHLLPFHKYVLAITKVGMECAAGFLLQVLLAVTWLESHRITGNALTHFCLQPGF